MNLRASRIANRLAEHCSADSGYVTLILIRTKRQPLTSESQLLYDADVEPDPTTLVKVLLLMTYQCDKPGDTKGRFYYLRIAVSLAADIGLNESLTSGHHSTKQLKMKRRLWWCCLMRENLLAMSERRTAGISTDISTVPIPHLDDLNDTDLSEALCRFYMPNSETDARILSKLCIQKIKLCVLIDRILDTLYELGHHQPLTTTGPAMLLIPKLSDSLTAEGIARDQELRQWYAELCSTEGSMVGQDHRRNGRVVGPHSAILEMLFYTVVGMVHRPLLLHTQSKESAANALQDFSRQTLRLAAQRITDIANPLAEGNLIRFLPSVGVPALLAASMQHVKDALSANHTISAAALMSLEQTMHSMVELRGIHCPVECTMGLFEFVRSRKINSQHTALGQESVPQYPGERPRSFATTSTRDSRTSLGHETLVYNNPDQSASVLLNQKHASTGAALTATVDDDSTRHGRATGIQQEELLNFRLPFANIESLTEAVLSGVCDAADFNAFHS